MHVCLLGRSSHLAVNELDDVGFVLEALEQVDLVNEATGSLLITPSQLDPLQRIDFAAGAHHLQQPMMPPQHSASCRLQW
jgi:hypothetical protein